MVLAVVVGILVFRVYQVLRPATGMDDKVIIPRPPSSTPPSSLPPAQNIIIQEKPEPRSSLLARHPFVWQAQGVQAEAGDGDTGKPDLTLLRIQMPPDGKPRAQIRSGPSRKWYNVGDPFESYELTEIDVENQTITIYSEDTRKPWVYKVE